MKKILVLLVVAGCGWGGWAWWKNREKGSQAEPGGFEPALLLRTNLVLTSESTGVVEPRNRLEVMPSIAGRIEDVLVVEGQAVKRGEIMAWLSSTERATLLDAARAKGPEMARKWEEIYRATPLVAPLDGTVIDRATEPGQTVTAADPVLVLSDRLIVRAQVDETDIGRIREGMAAVIRLDAYAGIEVNAVVRHIAFEATTVNNVTIYEVEVEPEHIPEVMRSGMTATVAFHLQESGDTWAVPVEAVVRDGRGPRVYVTAGGVVPEERPVSTGLTARGWIAITAGLQGDEPVMRPAFQLPEARKESGSPFMPARPPGAPRH